MVPGDPDEEVTVSSANGLHNLSESQAIAYVNLFGNAIEVCTRYSELSVIQNK